MESAVQNFNHTEFPANELLAMFRELNNAGLGFDGDYVTGEHVAHTPELDVYESGNKLILVGDANGLWAVAVAK
jgi:hypothetical protein